MVPQCYISIVLAFLALMPSSEGTQISRGPVFETFEIQDLNLQSAFRTIVERSRAVDPEGIGVNIVIDAASLADAQLTAQITLSVKDVRVSDLVWAICKRLGLGIRVDSNALYITSGGKTRLSPPPSPAAAKLVETIELKVSEKAITH